MLPEPTSHGEPASPAGPRRTPVQQRLGERFMVAMIALLVLMACLASVDDTYAMWRDSAELEAGTVTTGSASLTASWNSDSDEDTWKHLLPGESATRTVALENTGDVPLEVTVTAQTVADGFKIRAMAGACEGDQLLTPALGATAQPLAVAGAADTAEVLYPKDEGGDETGHLHACVEITASDELLPEDSVGFKIRFEGKQAL